LKGKKDKEKKQLPDSRPFFLSLDYVLPEVLMGITDGKDLSTPV